jgi:hypothetical protein
MVPYLAHYDPVICPLAQIGNPRPHFYEAVGQFGG